MKDTYVTTRVADVAPVRSSEYHVEAENGDASRVIVLVEDALKLHIYESCAFLEAHTARGVEAASLELWDRERSAGALLNMCLAESGWKATCRPRGRIGTVKSQRIRIKTIQIHRSDPGARSVVPGGSSIVADQRHHDTGVVELVFYVPEAVSALPYRLGVRTYCIYWPSTLYPGSKEVYSFSTWQSMTGPPFVI